jgi:cation:H+ antiporter
MAAPVPPHDDPNWQRRLRLALTCVAVGLLCRHSGLPLPPPLETVAFGLGLGGASFVLAWAGEAAETEVSGAVVLTLIAFVVVLPELVIEVHFAYTLQDAYATANLGGAIRLLLTCAVGLPLVAAWVLRMRGDPPPRDFELDPTHRFDLGLLLVASLVGVVIAIGGRVTVMQSLVLAGLYVLYLRRVNRDDDEEPVLFGVARGLASLPEPDRRAWIAVLLVFSAIVVVDVADPFAESVLLTGTQVGIDPFILVQSIVPIVTETPELVVAFVFVLHQRPGRGLALLIASPVSQWTLALASVGIAHVAGGGGPLPLDERERVELLLTAATTWMAVAALVSLRVEHIDSRIMLVLFAVQLAVPSLAVRAGVGVILAVVALDLIIARGRAVPSLLGTLRAPAPPDRPDGAPT